MFQVTIKLCILGLELECLSGVPGENYRPVFKYNDSWTIRGVSPLDVSSLFYFSQKHIGYHARLECDRSCVRALVGSNQR